MKHRLNGWGRMTLRDGRYAFIASAILISRGRMYISKDDNDKMSLSLSRWIFFPFPNTTMWLPPFSTLRVCTALCTTACRNKLLIFASHLDICTSLESVQATDCTSGTWGTAAMCVRTLYVRYKRSAVGIKTTNDCSNQSTTLWIVHDLPFHSPGHCITSTTQ